MTKKLKRAALTFNEHRNEWEVWYQSQVVAHGNDQDRLEDWAADHGYILSFSLQSPKKELT